MDIAKLRKRLKGAKQAQPDVQAQPDAEALPAPEQAVPAEQFKPDMQAQTRQQESAQAEEPAVLLEEQALSAEKFEEHPAPEERAIPAEDEEPPVSEPPPVVVTESQLPTSEDAIVELLTFTLGTEVYAFKVSDIEEILRPQRYAPVPRTEDFIMGITSLRGKIIPLIDLKKRLSMPSEGGSGREKILILRGPRGSIGALVDKVIDVIRIPAEGIVAPPSHLSETQVKFLEGVVLSGGAFISVFRLEEALNFKVFKGV